MKQTLILFAALTIACTYALADTYTYSARRLKPGFCGNEQDRFQYRYGYQCHHSYQIRLFIC